MSARRVRLELQFVAEAPDDPDAGDAWADEVGDAIVETLTRHTPRTVYDESFSILDWNDEPEAES